MQRDGHCDPQALSSAVRACFEGCFACACMLTWHHGLLAGYSHITGGFPGGQAQYVRVLWGELRIVDLV